MVDDRDEEQQETYHKVDKRIGHQNEEAAAPETGPDGPAPAPDSDAGAENTAAETPAEEAVQIDMHGILRMVFGMCVEQAWVHLGLQLAPGAKETKMDLPQARLAIDTIAYIQTALGESLSGAEKREVEQILATLRMNYIQRT
ncbi:DUF1844 domain-containing protein [bacterium]|nr:DUF1844 domain-containing protein [bacterium]